MENKPNFTQWIDSDEGKKCQDISTLNEQKYLINRLFLAFDAGRDCVWSQYLEMKSEIDALKDENERLKEVLQKIKDIPETCYYEHKLIDSAVQLTGNAG